MKHFSAALFFVALISSSGFGQQKYVNWSLGYFTTWDGTYTPENLPWEAFTHVAYFQVYPQGDGSLGLPDDGIAKRLITEGHKRGKKVVFCIGGEGVGDAFKQATSNANRGKFISNMLAYMKRLGYDGFDTDWEEAFDDNLFVQWHKDLRDSINLLTPVPIMTIAAEDWFPVTAKIHMYVDQVNDMRYTGTEAPQYPSSLKVFTDAGADKSKLGAGMGVSMGNSVQHVKDICNMVADQGYGGVILWDITRNNNAPANMSAVVPFINTASGVVSPGPTKYYEPVTLAIDDAGGNGFPRIRVSVPSSSSGALINLSLFDMKGGLLKTLLHGTYGAGAISVPMNTVGGARADAHAGPCIVKLSAGNNVVSAKTLFVR